MNRAHRPPGLPLPIRPVTLHLTNSLSRRVEEFQTIQPGDFQERCHSSAALQVACINDTCCGSSRSSGG